MSHPYLYSGQHVNWSESHKPPPSGDVHGIVPPHCNGRRIRQQRGCILHRHFVDCCHGGCRGDTEWAVARWQPPVASDVALDILHREMPRALLQRLQWPSKWPATEAHSLVSADILLDTTCSEGQCSGPLKLTLSSNINLIGVINLFVCYWPPPATLDAVSATIVASGWAWFQ